MSSKPKAIEPGLLAGDPLWYKDAVLYELHIKSFNDSNADGVGDLRGLIAKLDYIQDLGVTALWLLPFYPSPLKDDGYDISNYTDVHAAYGTLSDFKVFLRAAHQRGIRVVTELVINHTSDQHPWFQRARRAKPGSVWRDFYVWSETPEKYQEARIIFKDFESSNWTWDPVAQSHYWHRFYSHQPDLNFDNPEVRKAIFQVMDFWLDLGVDGMRLDAVPYLFEREKTNCENLPETHAFLREIRRHVDAKYKDRILLAEANQWPEDAVSYFGSGEECHMAFHFPLMPRLFMAVHMEDRFPIIDILNQTPEIPPTCQWALFLRNHDELTLEMVTDEDRDYMYRVYADDPQARINLGIRRRLAPLLGNNRRKMELLNCLLLSMPGTPVIYYGDEIGMGDNIYLGDRNGVRTPMQWSADRNVGFSRANPQRLYLPIVVDPEYHFEAYNVETENQNLHSLLWWMKRLIQLRKRCRAFGQGSIDFLYPQNGKVLAFLRRLQGNEDEVVLVVANLSRFVQFVELDLSELSGRVPRELFGHTRFPPISSQPYFLTLGPHGFYWFGLEQPDRVQAAVSAREKERPVLEVTGSWHGVLRGKGREALERYLSGYLPSCRWFGGKFRTMRSVKIIEAIPVSFGPHGAYLTALDVQYEAATAETYHLPLAFLTGEAANAVCQNSPGAVIAEMEVRTRTEKIKGVLCDALADAEFCKGLLDVVSRRRQFRGDLGDLVASRSHLFRKIRGSSEVALDPLPMRAEQSNTSIIYGARMLLKIFRRWEVGTNPDLEIGRFLTEKTTFPCIPPLAGALEYRTRKGDSVTLGVLHGFVANQGDAWRYTLDTLGRYFEWALVRRVEGQEAGLEESHFLDLLDKEIPSLATEAIGAYLQSASLLGQRTAELHVALASDLNDPAFAPETFTTLYRRSLSQGMCSSAERVLGLLGSGLKNLSERVRADAEKVLALKREIMTRFQVIRGTKISANRIRCHGDYHLGQVLYTGKDFVIIDFEGEPARSFGERRIKRSPLRDVAGMLRSFHYAALAKLRSAEFRSEDLPGLEPWARFWRFWVSVAFLKAYRNAAGAASFLPGSREELTTLLGLYLLEKAIYELGYELNNRPDWVDIPIKSILELVQQGS